MTANNVAPWRENTKAKKLITCVQCQKSNWDGHAIVICDMPGCNNPFHLDCLDPPQANPPPILNLGKSRRSFICPRHEMHDLNELDHENWRGHVPEGSGEYLRFHKLRKPANPIIIPTSLTRGHKNNGLIEVSYDDEEIQFYEEKPNSAAHTSTSEEGSDDEDRTVSLVPAKGIILDMISKARAYVLCSPSNFALFFVLTRVYNSERARKACSRLAQARKSQQDLSSRPFAQQKAAINLVQLAKQNPDVGLGADQTHTLVLSLVVCMM